MSLGEKCDKIHNILMAALHEVKDLVLAKDIPLEECVDLDLLVLALWQSLT